MIIWHWACSKGGVGKTNGACNFAVRRAKRCARYGQRVCLIDSDPQLHANKFANRRRALEDVPALDCAVVLEKNKTGDAIVRSFAGYDEVIVDTAGTDAIAEMRSVLNVASVVIIPLAISEPELEACEKMQELLADARTYNPQLTALAFLNKVPPLNRVKASDIAEARAFIESFGIEVAESMVHHKDNAFAASWGKGLAVAEWGRKGEKAASDFGTLANEIERRLPGAVGGHLAAV